MFIHSHFTEIITCIIEKSNFCLSFLLLFSLNLRLDEERDLRLAIELSLQDSSTNEQRDNKPTGAVSSPFKAKVAQSKRHDVTAQRHPDYSSVVRRVPNRSVEDLVLADGADGRDQLGACGGLPRSPKSTQRPSETGKSSAALATPNTFGLIKDISVTNINMENDDKIGAFESKRFAFMNRCPHQQQQYLDHSDVTTSVAADQESRHNTNKPAEHAHSRASLDVDRNRFFCAKKLNCEMNVPVSAAATAADARQTKVRGKKAASARPFTVDPSLNNAVSVQKPAGDIHCKPAADVTVANDVGVKDMSVTSAIDPDDIHIDSVLLESMIQGADGYESSSNVAADVLTTSQAFSNRVRDACGDGDGGEAILLLDRSGQARDTDDAGADEDGEEAVFV